jgi:hypothetical protein
LGDFVANQTSGFHELQRKASNRYAELVPCPVEGGAFQSSGEVELSTDGSDVVIRKTLWPRRVGKVVSYLAEFAKIVVDVLADQPQEVSDIRLCREIAQRATLEELFHALSGDHVSADQVRKNLLKVRDADQSSPTVTFPLQLSENFVRSLRVKLLCNNRKRNLHGVCQPPSCL